MLISAYSSGKFTVGVHVDYLESIGFSDRLDTRYHYLDYSIKSCIQIRDVSADGGYFDNLIGV